MAWSASVTLVWWHLTPHWSVPLASTVTAKRMCELLRTSNCVFFITFECMENTLFTILGRSVTVCINSPVILCYTASSNINMQHFNIFTTELMVLFQFFSAENGVTNFGLILCLLISIFCYAKIHHKLRHQQAQVQKSIPQGGQPNREGIIVSMARYKKTVSIIMWVQLALVACYVPWGIVAVLRKNAIEHGLAWLAASLLVFLNSSLNPFLYCWKIREVRLVVKDTMRQFICMWKRNKCCVDRLTYNRKVA